MRKSSNVARADGFYKVLTLVGLAAALTAAGLTVWNSQRAQERAFALEAEVALVTAEVGRQQAEAGHIQKYLDRMSGLLAGRVIPGSAHYNFIADEVDKATKRLELNQFALQGSTAVAITKSSQTASLYRQRTDTLRIGGIIAGAGIVITFVGLLLWFWRVQRYVEIETQARMTTHLVEEIVARSRTEAVRLRTETTAEVDVAGAENMAVVTQRRVEIPPPPKIMHVA
jgi:hypothetical protein